MEGDPQSFELGGSLCIYYSETDGYVKLVIFEFSLLYSKLNQSDQLPDFLQTPKQLNIIFGCITIYEDILITGVQFPTF